METGTEANDVLVRRICMEVAAAAAADTPVPSWMQRIADVDQLVMEVNSGASFEQYFRWASLAEIERIVPVLRETGLPDVAAITEDAIDTAFPGGLPTDVEALEAATLWSDEQALRLHELFQRFEDYNGHITNVLGAYATAHGT